MHLFHGQFSVTLSSREALPPSLDRIVRHCLETGRQAGWLDLTVRPFWKFFRAYVLRLGFLDGWPGYYIAWSGQFENQVRAGKTMLVVFPAVILVIFIILYLTYWFPQKERAAAVAKLPMSVSSAVLSAGAIES